jgi:hypothetical protein
LRGPFAEEGGPPRVGRTVESGSVRRWRAHGRLCSRGWPGPGLDQEQPDAVVVIRDGGAVNDLAWVNDCELARVICELPLPALTGIGHERDRALLDEVAHASYDTPSKVIAGIEQLIVWRWIFPFDTRLRCNSERFRTLGNTAKVGFMRRRQLRLTRGLRILARWIPQPERNSHAAQSGFHQNRPQICAHPRTTTFTHGGIDARLGTCGVS